MVRHSTHVAWQGPLDGRAQTRSRAEEIMEEYRSQEARLTRRLRWVMVLAASAAAFIVYAVSAGDAPASHAGAAIAGTLILLAAGGQVRATRNKVRRLLESGAAWEIAQRTAAAEEAGPRPPGPGPLFSQQYCRVTRTAAGGRLQAGPVPPAFLVVVRDLRLVVVQAPGIPIMNAPVAAIQILKPRRQYLGAGTALRAGDQLWMLDFSGVHNAGQRSGFLRQLLGLGSLRQAVRLGREINDRFVSALLDSGASAAPDAGADAALV
jgi:hypothetical protein